jgi:hypothetical protein
MAYRLNIDLTSDYVSEHAHAFQSAHNALAAKYAYLSPSRKKLKELWKQVYGVTIIIDRSDSFGRWVAVEFESEKDAFAFILKWS